MVDTTQDAKPPADRPTRVSVCDQRKLFRQTLSIWLRAQNGLELVGSGPTLSSVAAVSESDNADAIVVCIADPTQTEPIFLEAKTLCARLPRVRLLAVTEYYVDDPTNFLANGFRAVVNASAGANGLLRVLLSGGSTLVPNVPEQTVADPGPLTPRETEVLSLVGQGSTMEDISEELGISPSTVASHKERIFDKLDANNQAHAVAKALDLGIMSSTEPVPGETQDS